MGGHKVMLQGFAKARMGDDVREGTRDVCAAVFFAVVIVFLPRSLRSLDKHKLVAIEGLSSERQPTHCVPRRCTTAVLALARVPAEPVEAPAVRLS